jgi:6-phosphofructokinase 1
MVDINSDHYRVAREYMVRLNRRDFEQEGSLSSLAQAAKMDVPAFVERFRPIVEPDLAEGAYPLSS